MCVSASHPRFRTPKGITDPPNNTRTPYRIVRKCSSSKGLQIFSSIRSVFLFLSLHRSDISGRLVYRVGIDK